MVKTVLLAIRPQETKALYSAIQKSGHIPVSVSSLSKARDRLNEMQFQVAVIDEDFDGPSTGWMLAESIRQHLTPDVKIIALGRGRPQEYWRDKELEGKFDWVMSFPISLEQLLHELNRNELITLS